MSLAYDFDTPVRAVQTSRSVACNETLDLMERMGVRLVFAKDEEIYGQDEAADLIYRVVKGAVRTSRLMSDGRRQIGDFYLARVYRSAVRRFRIATWQASVDRKEALVRQIYELLNGEVEHSRMFWLEATIVILILFEIVMALVKAK